MSDEAKQVPLLKLMRSVSPEWREVREVGEFHSRNVPYGRMLHDAAALIERQAAEIARLTAFQSSMRCPNCDVVRLQFMEAEADAQEQARLVGMGAEREAALMAERDDWKRLAGIRLAELRLRDGDAARFVALMPDADGKTFLNMPSVHPPFDFKCEQRYANIEALRAAIDAAMRAKEDK